MRDNMLTIFQNLIPLILRPLRICISPEQLRGTRILLLKCTHAPYVLAIWAYEAAESYLSTGRSGIASLGGPSDLVSNSLKRTSYLRSFTTPRTLVAASLSQASLLPRPSLRDIRAGRYTRPTTAATIPTAESKEDLKALVQKLSFQVEELTAFVAGQQQHQVDAHD